MAETPLTAQEDAARALSRSIVGASGTSFYWAMRLLPADKRDGLFAIYAFCRVIDDLVDRPGDADRKCLCLEEWRAEIDALYEGRAKRPLAVALIGPVTRHALAKEDFLSILDGMKTDARPPVRLPDRAALVRYCEQVACAVGRLSNAVFGVDRRHGDPVAHHLGLALQITNILRDLAEDATLDRCYLPADMLAEAGIDNTSPDQILAHPNLAAVCGALADEAAERFRAADAALALCDPKVMRAARIMRHLYGVILQRLVRRGWTTLTPRVDLGRGEKLWIGLRYGLGS